MARTLNALNNSEPLSVSMGNAFADCQVSVDRHQSEQKDGGEEIDELHRLHDLAGEASKLPVASDAIVGGERQRHQQHRIGEGHVEHVNARRS